MSPKNQRQNVGFQFICMSAHEVSLRLKTKVCEAEPEWRFQTCAITTRQTRVCRLHSKQQHSPKSVLKLSNTLRKPSYRPQGRGFSCWFLPESGTQRSPISIDPDVVDTTLTPGSAGINRCVAAAWLFKLTWTVSYSRSQSHTLKRRTLQSQHTLRDRPTHTHTFKISTHLLLTLTGSGRWSLSQLPSGKRWAT